MEEEKANTSSKRNHDFRLIGRTLKILEYLKKNTDEEHTATQNEILAALEKTGYACASKTLSQNLRTMMNELNPGDSTEDGKNNTSIDEYKIIVNGLEEKLKARELGLKEGSKKLQLRNLRYNHLFSFEELNQLIEAVLSLNTIDDNKKESLIKKLCKLSSDNFSKDSPYIIYETGKIFKKVTGVFEDTRTNHKVINDNLQVLQSAINEYEGAGAKIKFHFKGYDESKHLILRRNADGSVKEYIVNPYYIFLYNSKHYLICNVEPYQNVSIYRIDLMSDVSIYYHQRSDGHKLAVQRKARGMVKGFPTEWNASEAAKFQSEHLFMFYGEPKNITLKFHRDRYTLLHDYFGDRYTFKKHIDDQWDEVEVTCVPEALVKWSMQCSDYVEILSPRSLRDQIKENCEALLKRYQ